jgi:hypothetical protein
MPEQITSRSRTAVALRFTRTVFVVVTLWTALASPARAGTSATIKPSLSPDRLGAKSALTFLVWYTGSGFRTPSPVRNSILRLPAGLSLNLPHLRVCTPARLRAQGVSGCPTQSEIGSGRAHVEAFVGSLTIDEEAALWIFLGPPRNLQPTFEVLSQGYTPLDERVVFTGTVLPGNAPYGEALVMPIPAIPTLTYEPDASIVALSLTIGSHSTHRVREPNTVVVPSNCPTGGFPFAAEFTYADGSSGSAVATAPCPRREAANRHAHASKTTFLSESSHLHLTSKHNFTLNEQGSATGTATGTIYVHLTAVSTSRVTAELNIYPKGGSISGHGVGSYHRVGTTARFAGSMSIDRGTGTYNHIHGTGLSFEGTIEESKNDAITVHVSGRVSD